jgi:hypothetical protein
MLSRNWPGYWSMQRPTWWHRKTRMKNERIVKSTDLAHSCSSTCFSSKISVTWNKVRITKLMTTMLRRNPKQNKVSSSFTKPRPEWKWNLWNTLSHGVMVMGGNHTWPCEYMVSVKISLGHASQTLNRIDLS